MYFELKRSGREVGERHGVLKISLGGNILGNGTVLVVIREKVVGRVENVEHDCDDEEPSQVTPGAAMGSMRWALLGGIHFFSVRWRVAEANEG